MQADEGNHLFLVDEPVRQAHGDLGAIFVVFKDQDDRVLLPADHEAAGVIDLLNGQQRRCSRRYPDVFGKGAAQRRDDADANLRRRRGALLAARPRADTQAHEQSRHETRPDGAEIHTWFPLKKT